MQSSSADYLPVVVPRRPIRSTICAGATLITLGSETMPAAVWAARRGLKWQTVKMRRLRGHNWGQALEPELRKTTFMAEWSLHHEDAAQAHHRRKARRKSAHLTRDEFLQDLMRGFENPLSQIFCTTRRSINQALPMGPDLRTDPTECGSLSDMVGPLKMPHSIDKWAFDWLSEHFPIIGGGFRDIQESYLSMLMVGLRLPGNSGTVLDTVWQNSLNRSYQGWGESPDDALRYQSTEGQLGAIRNDLRQQASIIFTRIQSCILQAGAELFRVTAAGKADWLTAHTQADAFQSFMEAIPKFLKLESHLEQLRSESISEAKPLDKAIEEKCAQAVISFNDKAETLSRSCEKLKAPRLARRHDDNTHTNYQAATAGLTGFAHNFAQLTAVK